MGAEMRKSRSSSPTHLSPSHFITHVQFNDHSAKEATQRPKDKKKINRKENGFPVEKFVKYTTLARFKLHS